VRLAGLLTQFWSDAGHASEGRSWLGRALTAHDAPPLADAMVLCGAGWLAMSQGDYEQASPLLQRSLTLYREQGDTGGMARVLSTLGMVSRFELHFEQATTFLEESLALSRACDDKRGLSTALHNLGLIV
jgi:uncharacterized protein HemY